MALASAAAVAALALELGFAHPLVKLAYLRAVEVAALGVFVLDRFLRLALEADRREFFRHNSIDFLLMLAAVAAFVLLWDHRDRVLQAAVIYVIITQLYLLGAMMAQAAGNYLADRRTGVNPLALAVMCYLAATLVGACLLQLPRAVPEGQAPLSPVEAFFTASGAVTCTSLQVREVNSLDNFGRVLIMVLTQLGGLGMMIVGTGFGVLAGRRLQAGAGANLRLPWGDPSISDFDALLRSARFASLLTLGAEFAAAAVLYFVSIGPALGSGGGMLDWQLVFAAVFNAISAFCNAGFLVKMTVLSGWVVLTLVLAAVVGGLGPVVLADAAGYVRRRLGGRQDDPEAVGPGPGLSRHTRLALWTYLGVWLVGTVLLGAVELGGWPGETFGADTGDAAGLYSYDRQVPLTRFRGVSIFGESAAQCVYARSAGFKTVALDRLSGGGKALVCIQMLIGGAPGGTAGGFKVVTLGILLLAAGGLFRRGGRSISSALLGRAVGVLLCYLAWALLVILLVCMFENRFTPSSYGPNPMQLIFECCSAVGNCGLSTGVTPGLTVYSKYTLAVGMLVGRLLPVLLACWWTFGLKSTGQTADEGEVFLA